MRPQLNTAKQRAQPGITYDQGKGARLRKHSLLWIENKERIMASELIFANSRSS